MKALKELFLEINKNIQNKAFEIPDNSMLKNEIRILGNNQFIDSSSLFNYAYICNYINTLKEVFKIYINVYPSSSIKSLKKMILMNDLNFTYKHIFVIYQFTEKLLFEKTINNNENYSLYEGIISDEGGWKKGKLLIEKTTTKELNCLLDNYDRLLTDNLSSEPTLYIISTKEDSSIKIEFDYIFNPDMSNQFNLKNSLLINQQEQILISQEDHSNMILKEYMPNMQIKPFSSYFYTEHFMKHNLFKGIKINLVILSSKDNFDQYLDFINCLANPPKPQPLAKTIITMLNHSLSDKIISKQTIVNSSINIYKDIDSIDVSNLSKHILSELTYYRRITETLSITIDDCLNVTFHKTLNPKTCQEYNSIVNILSCLNKEQILNYSTYFPEYIEFLIEAIHNKYNESLKDIRLYNDTIQIPTNDNIQKLLELYSQLIKELKDIVKVHIDKIKEFEKKILEGIRDNYKEQGIQSENFNKFINNHLSKIKIACSVDNLSSSETDLDIALRSLGISTGSGIVGSLAVFGGSRIGVMIGSDALAGLCGGPIGVIAGVTIGVSSMIGQGIYYWYKNKQKLTSLKQDLEMSCNVCKELLIKEINDFASTNQEQMKNTLEDVSLFCTILINHTLKPKIQ